MVFTIEHIRDSCFKKYFKSEKSQEKSKVTKISQICIKKFCESFTRISTTVTDFTLPDLELRPIKKWLVDNCSYALGKYGLTQTRRVS